MVKCALLRIMAGFAADDRLVASCKWSEDVPEHVMPHYTRTTFQHPHVRVLMQLHDEIIIDAREDVVVGADVRFPVNVKVGKTLDQLETMIKAGTIKQSSQAFASLSQQSN